MKLIMLMCRAVRYRVKQCLLITVVICAYVVFILPYTSTYYPLQEHDTSCHYEDSDDDLPLIDENCLPEKLIFFHETSCNGGLTLRQACSVESAARANPEWQVHVFFTGPTPLDALKVGALAKLQNYTNIKFSRVKLTKYVNNTPLMDLITSGILNTSSWRVHHTADMLRYLSLYKFGGVYLDLDVIVAKSFDSLPNNWAGKEYASSVATGALSFSKDKIGRKIANITIQELKYHFQPHIWSYNSNGVFARALQQICSTRNTAQMSADTCEGFHIFENNYFYPIPCSNWRLYFQPGRLNIEDSYGFHIWNYLSSKAKVWRGSLFAKLAKEFCPKIYQIYEKNFDEMERNIFYNIF